MDNEYLDEKLLVEALKEGSSDVQEFFLEHHGQILLRFNTYVLDIDDPFEAEDLAIETIYKAFQKLETFKFDDAKPNGFKNWLFTIARNAFLDKKRRTLHTESIDDYPDKAVDKNTPEKVYEQEVSSELLSPKEVAVQKALAQLPENHRVTLKHFADGWSLEEIASYYDVNSGTVRQWKSRGMAKLKEILKGEPVIRDMLNLEQTQIGGPK